VRYLTEAEQEKIQVLTENSISIALIEPTVTGLKKGILDATGTVRNYLLENGIHDYKNQKQGQEDKRIVDGVLIKEDSLVKSRVSLYRPTTKKGDPRIWFKGLPYISEPNDIVAILFFDKKLYAFNITKLDIENLINSDRNNPLKEIVKAISKTSNSAAEELLEKLYNISAKGFIPSLVNADTGIGRTLETELGIDINSSKKPDFKGIELKTFRHRAKRVNRKTLFAQVPNWKLSQFKSSAEILDNFGYWREEDFKLYCTVSTITTNSQGLKLKLDTDLNYLLENSDKKKIGNFVVWTLDKLHKRLLEKHNETFWIEAESVIEDGNEHFHFKKAEYTRKPITSQFDILLNQGLITLDHLIKRNSKGKVVEKGPLFKIRQRGINLLFPPSVKYDLVNKQKI
jgi:hypothetical protein